MNDCPSPNAEEQLGQFIVSHEEWLMERILKYAKEQGYTQHTSTLFEAWRQSISGLTRAVLLALDTFGLGDHEFTPEDTFRDDPVSAFAVGESRLHRKRGISLSMFLGMFKYYRQTYLDLILEEGDGLERPGQCRRAVGRCFDRLEIAFCTDWTRVKEQDHIEELQHRNRLMTNEKNRLLTLFESLVTPVLLLDGEMAVETMNLAAAQYLGVANDPGQLYYARQSSAAIGPLSASRVRLRALAPWLAEVLEGEFLSEDHLSCFRFDIATNTALGPRTFAVAVSRMFDVSVKFSGLIVVLNDITMHMETERQLERERNRATSYLDIIGSIVLALDASGAVTLFNKAGLVALEYEKEEVLGRDWFDLAIPEDERETVRKYFHSIISQGAAFQEEYVNSLVSRSGKRRLISWNSHLLTNDEGHPVGVLSAGKDITAQAEADKLLREREKLYRAFFENNHAVMLLQDPRDGSIVDANPAASSFYGYSVEAMRKMNIADIDTLSGAETFQEMAEAYHERRASFLSRHRLANSEIRDVETYSGPILVQGRQLIYSLVHDVTARIRLEREMERMATTDALTGADNRHQFFRRAEEELSRANRYRHPLTVLMLDVDYFKSINDAFGHQSGDAVLKALVAQVIYSLRETDVFGRLGGEEFAAILPETDLQGGLLVAERLREELQGLTVKEASGNTMHFTVSIGAAERTESDASMEAIIRRADEALYRAKRMGRNRVEKG